MRTPTTEQLAILSSDARIRVVRAAPGSGKTWLVAELIRRDLEKWNARGKGIAALSFTRVGGEEIRRAIGHELGHPHFVGTIDAFLFRYVLRPFLSRVFPTFRDPRLVPAEWSPATWTKGPGGVVWQYRGTGGQQAKTYNVFDLCFIDEDNGRAVFASPRRLGGVERVVDADREGLMSAKRSLWERYGWVTHSDAAFLASKVLGHNDHGPSIRAELIGRFPLIIVDELQDTGYFLGQSIHHLLTDSNARGVLVGDPDQAIYEFNGARPDLCDRFLSIPGARELPLATSLRCPAAIADVVAHVKQSGGVIGPAPDRHGRAILVRCQDPAADVARIAEAILPIRPNSVVKIITRKNVTVDSILGRRAKADVKLGCPVLNHMQRGTRHFRQGRHVPALAAARAAIDLAVFEYEGVTEDTLAEYGIDAGTWKALAVRCLLRAADATTTGTLLEWQQMIGAIVDEEIITFQLAASLSFTSGKLKPKRLKGWDKPCLEFLPSNPPPQSLLGAPVQTVHSVKGETHDTTVFVCREPDRGSCPPTAWCSAGSIDQEEQRIAYVAMTRTRGDLIFCISDGCYQQLQDNRASFAGCFESMTVDEFVARERSGADGAGQGQEDYA